MSYATFPSASSSSSPAPPTPVSAVSPAFNFSPNQGQGSSIYPYPSASYGGGGGGGGPPSPTLGGDAHGLAIGSTDADVPDSTSSITGVVAAQAVQSLVCLQARAAGFDGVESAALRRLEAEVVAFTEELYRRAHEYANVANRAKPLVTDLLLVSLDHGLHAQDLYSVATRTSRKRKRLGGEASALTSLVPPPPRSPSPDLLGSDDEGAPLVMPMSLRALPHTLPDLPPKHTYLKTPIGAPKKTVIPSLDKKLKTAGLVQDSLKNLLLATEDLTGQEDGKLLGHIVNWEPTSYQRKRWKVGS